MDIKTFLDNIHEHVCCPVCMTRFTNPKQLPCLHSFCLHCLQRIQQTSGIRDTISCPECRRNFRIPGNGDFNVFPTNFRINSLLDALPVTECNTSGIKCGNCEKASGESAYCFTCCSFWCDHCLRLHNGLRSNKEHHVLALRDFRDEDFEEILKQPTLCGKKGHEKKELEFFCQVCEITICNACALLEHEGHAKILLEDAANERNSRVKAAIESKKRRALEKMTRVAKIDENCISIQERAARVKSDVQQFAERFIAAIEAQKNHIFDEVENKVRESLQLLGEQRHEIEEDVKMQETEIEKTEMILKRSTNAQLMQPHEFLEKIVQEKAEEEDSGNCDIEHVTAFVFKGNEKLYDDLKFQHIGCFESFTTKTIPKDSSAEGKGTREGTVGLKAEIVVTTRNTQKEQCYQELDCVTLEMRNGEGRDSAIKTQIQDNKDGTYKINYFAKETGTCQASVKVNGEHVRGSPFEVQVKRRQFRPVLSFGQRGSDAGMLSSPWGVAVNDKDEIAVSESGNHRVQIFASNGTHLKSFGKKGNQQGDFNFPAGIAFHNDKIIVVDTINHRVQLFSDEGHYLNQFGGEGSRDHQLQFPYGLSIDSGGNIIVGDKNNKLIKFFSLDGRFLRSVGTEGSFIFPLRCIQQENYLIVSDYGGHCIKVFNREGKFLYKFGNKGKGDGEFENRSNLSVDRAGHLLVCDSANHRVQVFKLSGEFVTKFGEKGAGAGEFNVPFSTAVLSDGKIIVTDYYNHRVQIFE
ncbi:E3 ubiquitin-protein ligase TRIM71-like [Montipora capricornis]|uniref:E3 ubiquitin-protein ligase TRIM71-like n=1 Tax=Montipora capricornis TaxID=246305 RepID=UPI0035F1D980